MILPDDNEKAQIKKAAGGAIFRLSKNDDFKAFQAYIELYLLETRERGDLMIGHEKEWNQGWCQALSFVLGVPGAIRKEYQKS